MLFFRFVIFIFFISSTHSSECLKLIKKIATNNPNANFVKVKGIDIPFTERIGQGVGANIFTILNSNMILKLRRSMLTIDDTSSFQEEKRMLELLERSGVNVPKVFHIEEEDYLIKEYIPGITLPEVFSTSLSEVEVAEITNSFLNMAYSILKSNLKPNDLLGRNFIYNRQLKIWYLIDPGVTDSTINNVFKRTFLDVENIENKIMLYHLVNLLRERDIEIQKLLIQNSVFFFNYFFKDYQLFFTNKVFDHSSFEDYYFSIIENSHDLLSLDRTGIHYQIMFFIESALKRKFL